MKHVCSECEAVYGCTHTHKCDFPHLAPCWDCVRAGVKWKAPLSGGREAIIHFDASKDKYYFKHIPTEDTDGILEQTKTEAQA